MRILALVPGGISNQLLFFPTLEDLKIQYPKATIDVIVEPRAKVAYRVCPYIHEVLMFDYKDRNGLADYLNLLGIIRDREYDVAVTLDPRWTLALLLWLNGIPLCVAYESKPGWFISNPVPLKTEQYTAYQYHDLLQGLDIHSPCPSLKISLPKADIDWAEGEQKRLDLPGGYVLISGGVGELLESQTAKNSYPISQWGKIIENIQQKQPNLPIVLLQGSDGSEWIKPLKESYPTLKVTKPKDTGKLAAMIAGANLIICPDSIPLQLAVAVGTYTVGLFGPTQATKLLPPAQDRYIGLQSKTDSIADISPETIIEQIWRS